MPVTAPTLTGTPQAFNFTTSGTVVTYTGGGTANATTFDILCVNSDNVVSTPSGWTLARSEVTNQGAYIFYKSGGTTSATIALGGGTASNTSVLWQRITNATAVDAVIGAQINSSGGSTTPSATTATLTEATELVFAFSASHNFSTVPAAGAWSSGYTEQVTGNSVTGGTNSWVFGSMGVKVPAGTAAESPSYTWSGGTQAQNRYLLIATFTGFNSASGASPTGLAVPVALGTPSAANTEAAAPTGIAVPVALGTPSAALNRSAAPTGIAVPVALGTPSAALNGAAPTGLTVPVALGTPSVALGQSAAPTGIAIPVNLGTPSATLAAGPTGIAIPVALGTPSVALNRSAAPSGLAVPVALGNPSTSPVISPTGLGISVSLGSPTVTTPAPSADTRPGGWYGLLEVDRENLRNLKEDMGRPAACPNDGEPLTLNPRTKMWQCTYDGYVYAGW